jgi:hypothetical protein
MLSEPILHSSLEIKRLETVLRDAHQSLVRAGSLSARAPAVDQRTRDVLISAIQDGLDDLVQVQSMPERHTMQGRLHELARFSHELDALEQLLSSNKG